MNLQGHAGFHATVAQHGVDADHGDLDEVGSGALQRGVDGGTLGEAALVRVFAVDVGDGADAAEQRFYLHVAAGFVERLVDEGAHALVPLEICRDELFSFGGLDAELLRESEGREAVDDAEVYDLGLAPVVGCDHEWGHAEDLRGGQGVNVVATAVGFDEQRIARKMGEQTQFDLRIIGGEQNVTGLGDEGGADAAAEFGADGDILQIRIG